MAFLIYFSIDLQFFSVLLCETANSNLVFWMLLLILFWLVKFINQQKENQPYKYSLFEIFIYK